MRDRISWDECFMRMAEVISERSPDPHQQVGAIIVKDRIILGAGYNAMPRGINQDRFEWNKDAEFLYNRDTYVVHAEANAVHNASQSLKEAKIYCTLFPCHECAKTIIQTGIKEVIYQKSKTKESTIASERLFMEAGVKCKHYKI